MWIYIVTLFAINYNSEAIPCPNKLEDCAVEHVRRWTDTTVVRELKYCERWVAFQRFYKTDKYAQKYYELEERYAKIDSIFKEK